MQALPFELGPIRPVDEARSLLIRTTRGCSWNRCEFCTAYKEMPFSLRSLEEIKSDITAAAKYYDGQSFETCFLQDGNSFIMKTKELVELLGFLKQHFPTVKRISSYGRAKTVRKKGLEELKEICAAGLNTLYCGMESGSDTILKKMQKGSTADDMIASGLMAKEAGMTVSEFIILGLGGQELWQEHASETAAVLNKINPHFIRALTIGVKAGSGIAKQLEAGEYTLQTEKNIIEEQRLLIEHLDGISSFYANHHGVDLLMEARGQLPEDKPKLLAIMDRYLSLPEDDRLNYTLGKRIGYYQVLDDMRDEGRKRYVAAQVREVNESYPGRFDEVCHHLRQQVV